MASGGVLRRLVRRVYQALDPGRTLAGRAVTGSVWVGLLTVTDRLVRLGTLVVLTQFLGPSEFGLVGLAALVLAVLRKFSRLGFEEALVQRPEADVDPYLDTVWTAGLARAVVLSVVAVVAAPVVASAFDTPRLTPVIRVLALSPLLAGLRNPGVVYFRKELAFHREFAYTISGTALQACTALVTVVAFGTVWALVAGMLAGTLGRTVASYLVHGYRPRLAFDAGVARDLFGFGKWIFGSGILVFLLNRGDDAVVGWVLGTSALGLYQMAFRLSNAPATEVTHVISDVAFPAFSQVQDDAAALREGFFRTVRIVAYLSFPMAVGIAVVAPTFVDVFLGPGWSDAVTLVQALAVWGALRALVSAVGPLFRAVDHPEYSTALQFSRLVLVAVLIWPAISNWGLLGAALTLVASGLLQNPLALVVAVSLVDGRVGHLVRTLLAPVAGSLFMGQVVVLVDTWLVPGQSVLTFVLLVTVGVVVYVTVIWVGHRSVGLRIDRDLGLVRESLGR